jgi:hypothetical protein
MSLAAYALAVRNHLRENLTSFYDNTDSGKQLRDRQLNCDIMLDELPRPNCGREFIAIYGWAWGPKELAVIQGVDEAVGIEIAVSQKTGDIPYDYRGALAYIKDESKFVQGWVSLEQRLTEIIGLIDKSYPVLNAANTLLDKSYGLTEPFQWIGCDPKPRAVGEGHFNAGASDPSRPANLQAGLVMRVRFGHGVRLQDNFSFDQ